jgi:hypothetical protein
MKKSPIRQDQRGRSQKAGLRALRVALKLARHDLSPREVEHRLAGFKDFSKRLLKLLDRPPDGPSTLDAVDIRESNILSHGKSPGRANSRLLVRMNRNLRDGHGNPFRAKMQGPQALRILC